MTVSGPSIASCAVEPSGEVTNVSPVGEPPKRAVHAGGGPCPNSSSTLSPEYGTSTAIARPFNDPPVPPERDQWRKRDALVGIGGHRAIADSHPRVALDGVFAAAEAQDQSSVGIRLG